MNEILIITAHVIGKANHTVFYTIELKKYKWQTTKQEKGKNAWTDAVLHTTKRYVKIICL